MIDANFWSKVKVTLMVSLLTTLIMSRFWPG